MWRSVYVVLFAEYVFNGTRVHTFFALSLLPRFLVARGFSAFGGPRIRPNLDITAWLPIGLGREGCCIRPFLVIGRLTPVVNPAELNEYDVV